MIKERSLYAFLEEIKPLNILLVDDDMATQFVIAKSLNQLGDRLDICDSAHEALKRVQRNHYDLVIVDLNLPVINGFELAKSLKITGECNGKTPKIIGLTVMDHPLLPTLVIYSEIDDYVVKTADYTELQGKIVNQCYLSLN